MKYMADTESVRSDPTHGGMLADEKSVIVFAATYWPRASGAVAIKRRRFERQTRKQSKASQDVPLVPTTTRCCTNACVRSRACFASGGLLRELQSTACPSSNARGRSERGLALWAKMDV